jgi:hypothetical protein
MQFYPEVKLIGQFSAELNGIKFRENPFSHSLVVASLQTL